MRIRLHTAPFTKLSDEELRRWANAESAAVSDCLGRTMAMDGGISPLDRRMRVVGQARTVRCMVGDNSALHAALTVIAPREVLVVDAGGYLDRAVWGGLMTRAARKLGVAGLVVDGAVRDVAEICDVGFPCFARAEVPLGPHKNFGGEIDATIACGGLSIRPGDLMIGDADGVAVVPIERIESTLSAYSALKDKEKAALEALEHGGTLADVYGVPAIERIDDAD